MPLITGTPQPKVNIDPRDDGIRHINIYSRSLCELGRELSNFSRFPIIHPEYGNFESIEGFWYYISSGMKYEQLRTLFGFSAKKLGKSLPIEHIDNFIEIIKSALLCRLQQHPELAYKLNKSTIPLTHYYYYGKLDNCKIIYPQDSQWLVDFYTDYRNEHAIR